MGWSNVSLSSVLANTRDFEHSAKKFGLSYLIECKVCEKEALADRGEFPKDWQITSDGDYILCPECANKLKCWVKTGKREEI